MANRPVRAPRWSLNYAGSNISGAVAHLVESITYTDNVAHAANDIQIVFTDDQKKWQGPWFPTFGDIVSLDIGYAGEGLLPCGDFQVDQCELKGPPDTFHVHAISAGITTAMRTKASVGYEAQTLPQIAATIAAKHGLSVVGLPDSDDAMFNRITKHKEGDLAFLHRLATMHDYAFNVVGGKLVFYAMADLAGAAAIQVVRRTDVEEFEFKNITLDTYSSSTVSYFNPDTKALVSSTAEPTAGDPVASTDALLTPTRAESASEATLKARGLLAGKNRPLSSGHLKMPGTIDLVAGNNINVSGFGNYDAVKYMIMKSTHKLDRDGGYTTELELMFATA